MKWVEAIKIAKKEVEKEKQARKIPEKKTEDKILYEFNISKEDVIKERVKKYGNV